MGEDYDASSNAFGCYTHAIDAIRLAGVKAGRFLPLPDRPAEIKASPIVDDVKRVGNATLFCGDSTRIIALLAEDRPWIDACVTDPPYELGFMGKSWDSSGVAAAWQTWGGVRIALKPGGHLVAFAGSRTYHRIAKAIDDAGFEVRDQLMWIYGSGFPKSMDVAKCIDKRGGVWRGRAGAAMTTDSKRSMGQHYKRSPKGEAVFDDAKRWEGWGTALKPAHEPVCFARKPLSEKTVAENVLAWATGAINVDAGRVGYRDGTDLAATAAARVERDEPNSERWAGDGGRSHNDPAGALAGWEAKADQGRWPANVMTDGSFEVLEVFPPSARDAVRFFYSAKASRDEREEGLAPTSAVSKRADAGAGDGGRGGAARVNIHPTVKPVDLMRWLCRLVTPPGGVVLDPFMGSGSTGVAAIREGFQFVGVEQSRDYFEIAHARISAAVEAAERVPDLVNAITAEMQKRKGGNQGSLF